MIGKRHGGHTYYYLAETARVGGRPRIVAQRYLGRAEEIAAAVDARAASSAAGGPTRARRLPFGDVAAVWQTLRRLDLVALVDAEVPARRGAPSVGLLVALAVLHRVVAGRTLGEAGGEDARAAPGSSPGGVPDGFATWWSAAAVGRIVRGRGAPRTAPTGRQVRRALRALTPARVERIERALHARLVREFDLAGPVLAIDLPSASTAAGADVTAGVGLLVAADGAVPLAALPYRDAGTGVRAGLAPAAAAAEHPAGEPAGAEPGTAGGFGTVLARLTARHADLAADAPLTAVLEPQRRAHLDLAAAAGVAFIGSLPPGEHAELLAAPSAAFRAVDAARLPAVTAVDTRARVSGAERRVVVVRSESSRAAAERAFAAALRTAVRQLGDLAAALGGTAPPGRAEAATEAARITAPRRVDRVLATTLTTTTTQAERQAAGEPRRADAERPRLAWRVDEAAYARVRALFGRQLLVTDRYDWPLAELLVAYRARGRLAGTFELLAAGDAGVPGAGHALVGVLATTVTHLMRREAQRGGLDLSARELLDRLAGITETRLTYPSTGGRPPTRRLLDELTPTQHRLFELFGLSRYTPRNR